MSSQYEVADGDCLGSVAYDHGFFWETLWKHGDNAELVEKRQNPNMLRQGDLLSVPDARPRVESRPTEKRHRFRRKGVPVKLRLRIMELPRPVEAKGGGGSGDSSDGAPPKVEPTPDLPYILSVDGASFEGTTKANGMIECVIPPNSRTGLLTLEPGTPRELNIPLKIGSLNPADEITGSQARLNNLGYSCGPVDGIVGPRTRSATSDFQNGNGMKPSGQLDKATKDKLRAAHDLE
jgi:hypothetical protein